MVAVIVHFEESKALRAQYCVHNFHLERLILIFFFMLNGPITTIFNINSGRRDFAKIFQQWLKLYGIR